MKHDMSGAQRCGNLARRRAARSAAARGRDPGGCREHARATPTGRVTSSLRCPGRRSRSRTPTPKDASSCAMRSTSRRPNSSRMRSSTWQRSPGLRRRTRKLTSGSSATTTASPTRSRARARRPANAPGGCRCRRAPRRDAQSSRRPQERQRQPGRRREHGGGVPVGVRRRDALGTSRHRGHAYTGKQGPCQPYGATGVGVRLVTELCRDGERGRGLTCAARFLCSRPNPARMDARCRRQRARRLFGSFVDRVTSRDRAEYEEMHRCFGTWFGMCCSATRRS